MSFIQFYLGTIAIVSCSLYSFLSTVFKYIFFYKKKNAKDENKRSELSKSYHCVSAQSLKYRDKDQIET